MTEDMSPADMEQMVKRKALADRILGLIQADLQNDDQTTIADLGIAMSFVLGGFIVGATPSKAEALRLANGAHGIITDIIESAVATEEHRRAMVAAMPPDLAARLYPDEGRRG